VEKGEPQRRFLIGRRQSYHGNTLGALAVGGNTWRRRQFQPLLIEASHVSPCYAYRGRQAGESDVAYGERLAAELDAEIRRLGGDQVIAFVAETVVGATLGAATPVAGYFRRVREVCDRYGVLLILDEVMCGMGRCGTLWAFEQEGVVPDLAAVAKGLGAGYQPIGAVMVSGRIHDTIVAGSGFFQHGHTYLGHAAACAGALAVQRRLHDDGLLGRVAPLGTLLEQKLRAAFGAHAHVGDIRGRGLFWGLELVADKTAKTPFEPALRVHARVKQAALAAGLMCYPMGGTLDGARGDHVLLAPPFIVEEHQLDELVGKLGGALDAVLKAPVAA
jgi:adenosylmethionine-8-amino-7-oxononanoate aminotransferase